MGDHGTTPVHQQQCNDNTIIIVNIPQLAGENNTSHIQLLPQDVSGVCPMTSQQYSTTFTSIQPHQQQQISGTIAANTQSSQENSQCYAKEELDGLILNQQDLMTARTVNYSSSALIFDRTASVRSDMSPAEEMSLEVTQITSPADGYFSRENIRRVHQHSLQSGLVHAMSRSESPSLPTDQARQRAGQITGFSTPPPSVPQMKLDFSKEDSSSLDASDDCYFSRDVTVHQTDPAVRAGRTVAQSQQKIAVLTSKRLHTVTRVSSTTSQCLVGAVPSPTDSRVVNISDPSKVSSCSHTRENTSQPRHICVVAAGAHSQVSEAVSRYHRPQYSYLHLIQMAISSTPDKQMTLKQIYRWIEDNFLYYSYTPNQGWKNSIRHNLSLYDIFVRKKPSDDSKKRTSYWTLRLDVPLKSSKACRQQANNETPLSKGLTTTADTVQSSTVATPGSAARVQLSTALKTIMPGSNFSTSRQKKGPVPLLPKVSPMQAFALIPIQGAVMSPQPFLLSSWPVGSPHLTSTPSLSSRVQQTPSNTGVLPSIPQSLTGLKRNLEPCGEPCKKQVKIAPKLDKCGTTRSVSNMCSITRSACTPCQNQTVDCVTSRTLSSSNLHKSLRLRSASASELTPKAVVTRCHVTPRIMRQRRGSLSGIATNQSSFEDSGFDVSCHKADSSCSVSLPRPRMYRRKCSLKHSGTMYENQNDGIVSKCQRDHSISDLDSAIHSVGDALPLTPHRKTSTPFKESVCSPSWISPIKELTPLSGVSSHFDSGCFFTPDSATKPLCSALPCRADITDLYNSPKLHQGTCSIGIEGSPKLGSLRSLGMPGLTPLKSSTDAVVICSPNTSWSGGLNHSFTRLFDDCHLNPIIDDEINMDFSFSTLL